MDELQAKHSKELRDLQSRITQKKKSATKKTRKRINDECAVLERELIEKHQAQLAELDGPVLDESPEAITNNQASDSEEIAPTSSLNALQISDKNHEEATPTSQVDPSEPTLPRPTKKPNRQKARLARRAAEQEAQAAQVAEEASLLPDLRKKEREAMQESFEKHKLLEREINPDGHCLYSAVASQLRRIGVGLNPGAAATLYSNGEGGESDEGYRSVRITTANFIEKHPDDFAPFLEGPFDEYVAKIRNTAEWGGHLELQAIARAYDVDINIIQANGRAERFLSGQSSGEKQIWLAYYRHYFGLGEHYNALEEVS